MCGIAGIYAFHPNAHPVDRNELRVIRDHMLARGPDGSGEWFSADDRVALGHRRLAIIDLSTAANQPMISSDQQLVISFSGEIYNYLALRKELENKGYVFRTESDTEVLLHLYADKGEAMLHELRGMFAFAIWDNRTRSLLLARDAFGIKPLYYANNGTTLRFASLVKALLAGGQIDTTPQPAGHAGFFLWGSVPEPFTLYRGIHALPAGHMLQINEHGAATPTPWIKVEAVLGSALANPAHCSRKEALDHIAAALRDSISAHMVADVPVGVFLSAGLDSALISTLATEPGLTPRTLTLAFAEYAGTANDEAPLAAQLAASLGSRHASVTVQRADFENDREKLLAAMDQPSLDGVNTWFVARAAASQGIKVALSGLGGDELFASYPGFTEIPKLQRAVRPFNKAPWLGRAVRKGLTPLVARFGSPKYAGLLEYGGTLGGAYLLRRSLYMPWELPQMMDPQLAAQGLQELELASSLTGKPSWADDKNSRLQISALEITFYMRNQLLRDADWAGMAHSLEIRVPFVDSSLLSTIAPLLAAHPDITKAEVVATAAPKLPASYLYKPKTGFSVPVREWLLKDANAQPGRGLRGWARYIHGQFADA